MIWSRSEGNDFVAWSLTTWRLELPLRWKSVGVHDTQRLASNVVLHLQVGTNIFGSHGAFLAYACSIALTKRRREKVQILGIFIASTPISASVLTVHML